MSSPRIAVFTVITGGYDYIIPPLHAQQSPLIDFIVFSDGPVPNAGMFQVRPLPKGKGNTIKSARYPRMMSHIELAEYDITVYVDGNTFIIHPNIAAYAEEVLRDAPWAQFVHHERDCLYQEAEACRHRKLDTPEVIDAHVAAYRAEGFPEHFGLSNTNIIFRRQSDPQVITANELWWKEYTERTSRRDQMSFDYVRWKTGLPMNRMRQLWTDNDFGIRFNHPPKPGKVNKQTSPWRVMAQQAQRLLPDGAARLVNTLRGKPADAQGPVFRPSTLRIEPSRAEKELRLAYQLQIPSFLAERPTIVLVGCDQGQVLTPLFERYPTAEIVAFDPSAAALGHVRKLAEAAKLHNIATYIGLVGLADAETAVYTYDDGTAGVYYRHKHYDRVVAPGVDVLAHLPTGPVELIRINTGGMELAALQALEPILDRVQNLHVEYHDIPGRPQQLPEVLEIIARHGFKHFLTVPENPNYRPFEMHAAVRGASYQCWIAARRKEGPF